MRKSRRRLTWEDKTKHRKGTKTLRLRQRQRGRWDRKQTLYRFKSEQTDAGELNVSFTQSKVRPSR